MWLKLIFRDGSPLRINSEHIVAYGFDNENDANAFVSTVDGSYQVRDSVEEIDKMLIPLAYLEPS